MPPRYGKTELGVINWVAQSIGRNPKSKFIHLSYSNSLALDNSSKAKELIQSEEFQNFWPVTLKEDSKSKEKWYTSQGGGLYATSAGGAITGFGAGSTSEEGFCGAIIIDDPLKVDDAERDNERDHVNERLNTTIKSRRNSRHTPIIIIMQRLHEDDMSGFVLDNGINEAFYHLKLPAIINDGAEDAAALWEHKHTLKELERERKADSRTFAGQMMQDPSPDDGSYFKRGWFNRYDLGEEPEQLYKYGSSDYAVTEPKKGKEPDFTDIGIGGFDTDEQLWLVDWWFGKTESDKWIDAEQELLKKHEIYVWVSESGVIKNAVNPYIKKAMRRGKYVRREWLPSVHNKTARARGFQAMASAGQVYIPNTTWGDRLIEQLVTFPDGKYDDAVDVCGQFGRLLDQTYSPRAIQEEEKIPHRDPYADDEDGDDNWKTL